MHFELMQYVGEVRYGVFDRSLIESALARPQQAAAYDQADLFAQAATLCFGLIKNHPWIGGNKRTATYLVEKFRFFVNHAESLPYLVLSRGEGSFSVELQPHAAEEVERIGEAITTTFEHLDLVVQAFDPTAIGTAMEVIGDDL